VSPTRRLLHAGLLCAGALTACDPGPTDPQLLPAWSPSAVLGIRGVADVSILASEVSTVAGWVGRIYPHYAPVARRREALDHVILWSAATRAQAPEEHAKARSQAQAWLAFETGSGPLPDGTQGPPPPPPSATGGLHELGLGLWGAAAELEPGVWAGPLEGIGRLLILRLDARDDVRLEISLREFPYLPAATTPSELEELMQASELVVLDPDWAPAVPARWRYRMRGETP